MIKKNYLCRCCIKNANESRLACGNLLIAIYNSLAESSLFTFCTAFEKSFHNDVGINGSRNERRKSFIHPHKT